MGTSLIIGGSSPGVKPSEGASPPARECDQISPWRRAVQVLSALAPVNRHANLLASMVEHDDVSLNEFVPNTTLAAIVKASGTGNPALRQPLIQLFTDMAGKIRDIALSELSNDRLPQTFLASISPGGKAFLAPPPKNSRSDNGETAWSSVVNLQPRDPDKKPRSASDFTVTLPNNIDTNCQRRLVFCDLVIGSGARMVAALRALEAVEGLEFRPENTAIVGVFAAPEGVAHILSEFPGVKVFAVTMNVSLEGSGRLPYFRSAGGLLPLKEVPGIMA